MLGHLLISTNDDFESQNSSSFDLLMANRWDIPDTAWPNPRLAIGETLRCDEADLLW